MRERERESARAQEEKRRTRSRRHAIAPLIAISRRRDRIVDRDLAFARLRRREIREEDPSIAISPSRDRAVDRDLAKKARSRSRRRTEFVVVDEFFLGCGLCFSGFVFSFFFSKHQKIFSGNFLKCNQTHGNIFLFRKLAFPENVLQQPNTALAVIIIINKKRGSA